ncbi:unnamed protein product [Moneuplotes crassus]|uniref:N-acetyltransferase domain-containing protein n=1 Tax=Euplotes crassus TaxID=5936 RepID=A0AAD1XYT1_EUPCR|nr:unnamed protein product [Moneuplotes crassus]
MTTIRPFSMFDLLKYNNINIDILTETFYTKFYGDYLNKWPEYCVVVENSTSKIQGYLMGKVEGSQDPEKKTWHGHVTAITVDPDFRKQGLARSLMNYLEEITAKVHDGWFVDLFVRSTNKIAIDMYKSLGYSLYRRVLEYYSGDAKNPGEDAWDMRKSMPRDTTKELMVPLDHPIQPHELEFN